MVAPTIAIIGIQFFFATTTKKALFLFMNPNKIQVC